ncbi:MAG: S-adenosylmethionine synthase [Parcubacteria group bacterium GW2011_GWA2_47_8]|nr:MAG: S-adenosylmethionine synthase [Parcubacteria group bacterium GW2011_GWA2_47_8]OHB20811.1 MAG: methionine adenosyltransferase [Parcubacteria group bacterium RIFCSPHIGHO2_01_FULL_47_10b]
MFYTPHTYTIESVTAGHPDKICDQISDAIVDACLTQDPLSRVAVETFGTNGTLIVGGEVTTKASVNYEDIVRSVYREIGYDSDAINISVFIHTQSPDIAQGVNTGGAGDQGIMYGFATDETPQMLPWALVKVHELARRLHELRRTKKFSWLGPDGKTQITIHNDTVKTVLVSTQHSVDHQNDEIRLVVEKHVVGPVLQGPLPKHISLDTPTLLVNPTGAFVIGGFTGDTGLTGRKIMVDTYGGLAPHGGGCFSGKDATKVDRSAAYMARLAAKTLVSQGLAHECIVSVAYAIGKADPLMLNAVNEKQEDLSKELAKQFDFRPQAIIERLGLRNPIFQQTATYGHFGREGLPWEKVS